MADDPLKHIEQQAGERRNFDSPPLQLWHPPLSGDIPIRITADGSWYHDGDKISRESLVRLFASILRREDDGQYYLVTPAEKWRIEVELHPLVVVDIEVERHGGEQRLRATLNTGRQVTISEEYPLFLEPRVGDIAAISLDHGLSAILSRAAWYRLVEMAEQRDGIAVVVSCQQVYPLAVQSAGTAPG
jgi:uncharacterized protein